jgi:hypothetical protein
MKFTLDQLCDKIKDLSGPAYLASPYSKYSAGLDQATIDISKIAGALIAAGIPVYSPIAHFHTIAEHAGMDKLDYKIWLPINVAMICAAELLRVAQMPGWYESYGTKVEIETFVEQGKPVLYLDPETMELSA